MRLSSLLSNIETEGSDLVSWMNSVTGLLFPGISA